MAALFAAKTRLIRKDLDEIPATLAFIHRGANIPDILTGTITSNGKAS